MSKIVSRIIAFSLVVLAGTDYSLLAAENRLAGFSAEDTLTIRSAEARMDELPDIIHFDGGFELRASDWSLTSEQATLYGKLDDPETVVIDGSPATILLQTLSGDGRPATINGRADQIVYQRSNNSIKLQGNAFISRNEHSLSGGLIEYDIERDHLSAGGDGGIQIEVQPEPGEPPSL
jgi:lipopolysaccharide transport protein LptA